MSELNTGDYFECLKFNGKTLNVRNKTVINDGVSISLDKLTNKDKWIQLHMFNHDSEEDGKGYWMLAGATNTKTKYVIAVGTH